MQELDFETEEDVEEASDILAEFILSMVQVFGPDATAEAINSVKLDIVSTETLH